MPCLSTSHSYGDGVNNETIERPLRMISSTSAIKSVKISQATQPLTTKSSYTTWSSTSSCTPEVQTFSSQSSTRSRYSLCLCPNGPKREFSPVPLDTVLVCNQVNVEDVGDW